MRHDPLPPEQRELISLLADGAPFHLPDKRQAFFQIEHTALPLVKLVESRVFITRVVHRARFAAQVLEQIKIGLVHKLAVEIDARRRNFPGADR